MLRPSVLMPWRADGPSGLVTPGKSGRSSSSLILRCGYSSSLPPTKWVELMKEAYLEVTFRRGRAIAAYLYLPRQPDEKVAQSKRVEPGLVIDFNAEERPMGIEITTPSKVSLADVNRVLTGLGLSPMTPADLAPLLAA